MKFKVTQSIEQGLAAKFGGTFKLLEGVVIEPSPVADPKGHQKIIASDGKPRTVPDEIFDKLLKLKYIEPV